MLGRLRPFARPLAAASSAALAGMAAMRAHAEAAPATEEKPKPCLQLTLVPESTATVLSCYPAEYTRVVADRVLVRPCMTEQVESCPLKPLAVVEDGSTQSILIIPTAPLWIGPADISLSGRVGYPVLPISIAEEEEPQPPPPPPPPPPSEADQPPAASAAGSAAAAAPPPPAPAPAAPAAAEPAEETPPVPTLWEQVEEPWRLLEASGVLAIERDADSMPTRVSLSQGAAAWQGELPTRDGGTRLVTVRLVDEANAARLALVGRTLVPECGFCRFMKNGPCGEEFIAWEACVDAAKESGQDFVEACGKPTLALKACTDRNPEYYGMLDEKDEGDEPPPDASKAK